MLVKNILFLQHSGAVKRCHTLHTLRENTVAAHSWGVAVLAHTLWPDASKELILACLLHDAAETLVGDIPHPTKKLLPIVGQHMNEIEEEALHEIGMAVALTPNDQKRLKFCDMLDFFLFVLHERASGNQLVATQIQIAGDHLIKMTAELPEEDRPAVGAVIDRVYAWRILPQAYVSDLNSSKEEIL